VTVGISDIGEDCLAAVDDWFEPAVDWVSDRCEDTVPTDELALLDGTEA